MARAKIQDTEIPRLRSEAHHLLAVWLWFEHTIFPPCVPVSSFGIFVWNGPSADLVHRKCSVSVPHFSDHFPLPHLSHNRGYSTSHHLTYTEGCFRNLKAMLKKQEQKPDWPVLCIYIFILKAQVIVVSSLDYIDILPFPCCLLFSTFLLLPYHSWQPEWSF